MARWGKCDFKELERLNERLEQLSSVDFDTFCREAANEIAARLLAKVKKRTPVGVVPKFDEPKTVKVQGASGKSKTFLTRSGAIRDKYWSGYKGGTLRDAWTILPVEKHGDQYLVTVVNNTEYASYPKGAKVSHNSKHWISTAENNVWEPGVYGWEEVTNAV